MSEQSYGAMLRAKGFGVSRPRARAPKRTVDVNDRHTVEVTEHWSDRVDVTVRPGVETLHATRKDIAP